MTRPVDVGRTGPIAMSLIEKVRKASRREAARTPRRRRPFMESLEGRALLSITPAGPEFRANTYTAGDQQTFTQFPDGLPDSTAPVLARGANGSVITWTSNGQDGSSWGVYAQRHDASG